MEFTEVGEVNWAFLKKHLAPSTPKTNIISVEVMEAVFTHLANILAGEFAGPFDFGSCKVDGGTSPTCGFWEGV